MTRDFQLEGGRPGDQRQFVHKRIGKFVSSKFGGGVLGIGAGLVSSLIKKKTGATVPRTQTARPTQFSAAEKDLGRRLKFGGNGNGNGGGDGCVWPSRRDPGTGRCKVFLGERAGPDGGAPVGDAVMGMHGAGVEPGIMTIDRAVCGRKMVLGDDGLCYHKTQISNKERMWPRGRRPLITGGEMRAVGVASRAGARLDKAAVKLRGMGLMKPLPKRPAKKEDHHHHPAAGGS